MTDLYGLSADQLGAWLAERGAPAFRARQLRGWLYERGARSFAEMTDLPASLRSELERSATLGTLELAAEQVSRDGTRKRAYTAAGTGLIEAVLMPYADGRRTACISTQVGCAMGCVFCATGQMGLKGQLEAAAIFEQALWFARELAASGERLSNVVLMGMGEPLHNYDATVAALRWIMERLGIGARRITISTVGLVPQILRFAEEGLQVGLAVSLHAATDEARSALLPVNRRWPLAELIEACRRYQERGGRRITFEWALIEGANDDDETAARLCALVAPVRAHVNLIPLNPTAGYGGRETGTERAERFRAELERRGLPATLRVRRGLDIDAGCGQLTSALEGG